MDKINLVPAIKAIEKMISEIKQDYYKKIKPYQDSLDHLRRINTACEFCNGKGKILRGRVCAEDDKPNPNDPRDWNICPYCNGTGSLNNVKIHTEVDLA